MICLLERAARAAPTQVYPLVVGAEPIPPRGRHFFSVALSTCRWLGSFVGVVGEKLRVQGGTCAGEQLLEYSGLLTRSEGERRRQQHGHHAPGQRSTRMRFARTSTAPPHLLNGAFALVLPGLGVLSSRSFARAHRSQVRLQSEQPPPPQGANRATAQGRTPTPQRGSSFEASAHLLTVPFTCSVVVLRNGSFHVPCSVNRAKPSCRCIPVSADDDPI